jgi:hypothetical protein
MRFRSTPMAHGDLHGGRPIGACREEHRHPAPCGGIARGRHDGEEHCAGVPSPAAPTLAAEMRHHGAGLRLC